MRRLILVLLLVGAGYYALSRQQQQSEQLQQYQQHTEQQHKEQQHKEQQHKESPAANPDTNRKSSRQSDRAVESDGDDVLKHAFDQQLHDVRVHATGVVEKILRDDTEGSRHQRFIVRLASGQKILIAHNIDLASRVAPLSEGDRVEFSGEYEWNNKGGVVHWTHRDPAGRHHSGWIKHGSDVFK